MTSLMNISVIQEIVDVDKLKSWSSLVRFSISFLLMLLAYREIMIFLMPSVVRYLFLTIIGPMDTGQTVKKKSLVYCLAKTNLRIFWMSVLTDIKARGTQDILFTAADNLNGLIDTIRTFFPNSTM